MSTKSHWMTANDHCGRFLRGKILLIAPCVGRICSAAKITEIICTISCLAFCFCGCFCRRCCCWWCWFPKVWTDEKGEEKIINRGGTWSGHLFGCRHCVDPLRPFTANTQPQREPADIPLPCGPSASSARVGPSLLGQPLSPAVQAATGPQDHSQTTLTVNQWPRRDGRGHDIECRCFNLSCWQRAAIKPCVSVWRALKWRHGIIAVNAR